jgi:manganese oxidase
MEPGGNMAILAYKPLIDGLGMPKMHDQMLGEVFDKDYYAKKQSFWQQGDFAAVFGDAGLISPDVKKLVIFGLIIGLIVGLLIVLMMVYKRKQQA